MRCRKFSSNVTITNYSKAFFFFYHFTVRKSNVRVSTKIVWIASVADENLCILHFDDDSGSLWMQFDFRVHFIFDEANYIPDFIKHITHSIESIATTSTLHTKDTDRIQLMHTEWKSKSSSFPNRRNRWRLVMKWNYDAVRAGAFKSNFVKINDSEKCFMVHWCLRSLLRTKIKWKDCIHRHRLIYYYDFTP